VNWSPRNQSADEGREVPRSELLTGLWLVKIIGIKTDRSDEECSTSPSYAIAHRKPCDGRLVSSSVLKSFFALSGRSAF
jgi:hypothetical protein